MDIFSHGFWTAAAAEGVNRTFLKKRKPPLNPRRAAFWGVAPDLFSFGLAFAWLAFRWLTGSSAQFFPHDPAHPELQFGTGDPKTTVVPLARLTAILYQFTHSAVVFTIFFLLVWLLRRRRPPLEIFGWLFHIFIDIPTHSYRFYPTPFLWPISSWKLNGFSWAEPWFLLPNYAAILIVYLLLRARRRRGGEPSRA